MKDGVVDAVVEAARRAVGPEPDDIAHAAAVIEEHDVRFPFEHVRRLAFPLVLVRPDIRSRAVDDQHLVQPVLRVGMRADPDPVPSGRLGRPLQRGDVVGADLDDRPLGDEHFFAQRTSAHRVRLSPRTRAGAGSADGSTRTRRRPRETPRAAP